MNRKQNLTDRKVLVIEKSPININITALANVAWLGKFQATSYTVPSSLITFFAYLWQNTLAAAGRDGILDL